MTTPAGDPGPEPPRPPTAPTVRVARPPVPGPAKQAETASADGPPPPDHPGDEPTVGLPDQVPRVRERTLQFGKPAPVKVTVSARPRRRRRYPTWPWIVGVILALVVLGVILLVMFLRGATIDGGTDLIGSSLLMKTPAAIRM